MRLLSRNEVLLMLKDNVSILDQLPPVLQEVDELIKIASIEDPILTELWLELKTLIDDQFIVTASENGLQRREKMHKLKVSNAESLESRRLRILSLYSDRSPYTKSYLYRYLNNLLGEGNYALAIDSDEDILDLEIEATFKELITIIEERLEQILPQSTLINLKRLVRIKTHVNIGNVGGVSSTIYPYSPKEIVAKNHFIFKSVTLAGDSITIYPEGVE